MTTSSFKFDDAALAQLAAPPDADKAAAEYGCVFPIKWYKSILDLIVERGIVTITYDDLFNESDDRDHESCYEREFRHWHERVRDPQKTYLLIQHDVDFAPQFTRRMVAMEALAGGACVRSNVFVFNRFMGEIPSDSPYDDTPYAIDHEFFQAMQRRGFVIGYHQNALTVASDMAAAGRQFAEDVAALRKYYDIQCFCPHGGRPIEINGDKKYNYDVPVPAELKDSLRWVYNKHGPRFSGRYSDGGLRRINDPARLDRLNLEAFIESLELGKRYFALIHPQLWGYKINPAYNPALAERAWHQDVVRRFK